VTWPQRGYPHEPGYSWNNIDPTNGGQMDLVAQEPSIKLERDYFNRTPKPGYTAFVYPHPLVIGVSSTPTPTPSATPSPTPVSADLKVTVSDSKTATVSGAQDTYTIVVSNLGPGTVSGASVADNFPIIFNNESYTATQVGALGLYPGWRRLRLHGNRSGNIQNTVTMPAGSKITYKATGPISASATGSISDTATTAAPSGVTDANPANNSTTDTDTL